MINSVILKWASSLNYSSFNYSDSSVKNSINDDPYFLSLLAKEESISEKLIAVTYKNLKIEDFISPDTIFELFSEIEHFEESFRQEYSIHVTNNQENITISNHSIYCEFYNDFISIMIDRVKNQNSETFLTRNRTLTKLETAKYFYENCLINPDNLSTFSALMSMSKKDFYTLHLKKTVDFINNEKDFNLALKSLIFRTTYVANVNFVIRLYGIQINYDLLKEELKTMLLLLIIMIIINFFFYIFIDCIILKTLVFKLIYKRSIIMIIPIENILEQNPEFEKDNKIFE